MEQEILELIENRAGQAFLKYWSDLVRSVDLM